MEELERGESLRSPHVRYLSDDDVFTFANILSGEFQQTEVQEILKAHGFDVSPAAVSKMLSGERKMIKLAMTWVEIRLDRQFERGDDDEPVRFWKLVNNR